MNKVFANLKIRSVQEDERIIEGVASSIREDRMSDVVEPRGIVYALPTPFLMDHDHKHAVGEVEHLEVSDNEIRFRARIPKITEDGAAKTLTDDAWSLIKGGLRKSVSIGFRPLAQERIQGGGYRFTSWELLELSACAVPAQPDARITATRSAAGRGHVVRTGKPAHHVVKLRTTPLVAPAEVNDKAYAAYRNMVGALNARSGARAIPVLSRVQWIMIEATLDAKVPGRLAKKVVRYGAGK